MIPSPKAFIAQYLLPIVGVLGLLLGGGLTYLVMRGAIAIAHKETAELKATQAEERDTAVKSALATQAEAQAQVDADRARIESSVANSQAAVVAETAKLRKQLGQLAEQQEYACLNRPLPDAVLDGLRR